MPADMMTTDPQRAMRALRAVRVYGRTVMLLGLTVCVAFLPWSTWDTIVAWSGLQALLLAGLIAVESWLSSLVGERESRLWLQLREELGLDRARMFTRPFYAAWIAFALVVSALIIHVRGSAGVTVLVVLLNGVSAWTGWYVRRRLRTSSWAPYAASFVAGMIVIASCSRLVA
jgi:hypothetical protein